MKKFFIAILIILLIVLGGGYYLLTPNQKVTITTNIDSEEILKNSHLQNVSIKLVPPKVQGDVVISQDSLEKGLPVVVKKLNPNEQLEFLAKIEDGSIKVYVPYKVLGFIDTQLELTMNPIVENNNVKLQVVNAKLGKIKISEEIVKKELQKISEKNENIKVEENNIIITKEKTDPIIVNSIKVNSQELILNVEITGYDILHEIQKYGLDLKL